MARDVRLIRTPVSVAGMVLTTVSAVLFLVVFLAEILGVHTNPYLGIVVFLVLPAVFLVGLALIPLGAWRERRRRRAGRPASEIRWPTIDLNNPATRRTAVAIFALTTVNIIIVSLAAFRGVEYMDSTQFCGQVCHQPMKPEFAAHQNGPHARVACVECHVGSGPTWFARSKVSGTRQLLALMRNSYSRPIPAPVHNLRPADDTCAQCHWPEKFHGDLVRPVYEYSNDEKSTESVTALRVHVGGGSQRLGIATGIHWHMNLANEIEYVTTDDKRQVIPYVRVKDASGQVREYFAQGVNPDEIARGERRRMDCVDCHNRSGHDIAPTAERAVDAAIARGEIPRTLPFVRRETINAVKAIYPTQDAAVAAIADALRAFYTSSHSVDAGSPELGKAVAAAQQIYRRNVFPEMHVQFGTYPDNIGHIDSPGCFRCHDDTHATKDGRKIGQECETCHAIE